MKHLTMINKAAGNVMIALATLALIAACGGSDSGSTRVDDTGGIDAGGTPSRLTSVGAITGFGSVIVNGVHYDTSQAEITTDDQPATEIDLKVGQVVRISGTTSASATSIETIEFDDNVEGPVQSIDRTAGSLVVLGQNVLTDGGTVFDDSITTASLDGINVGDIVEVSGFRNSSDDIVATHIELKPAGGEMEITGLITSLDTTALTFMVSQLLVNYNAATLTDFPGGVLSNGDLVEAKGTQLGVNDELLATSVEFKNDAPGADTEFEIEGFITRFVSATDFDVSNQPVTTNGQTIFEGGTAVDLALNIKIEAEGVVDAQGVLVAEKIEFKRQTDIRMQALVDSVDAAAGRLVMLGISVEFSATTSLEDKVNDLRPFSINDINPGDWLEVRGGESSDTDNLLVAVRVERDDPDTEARIRGIAENVADPSFEVLGLAIDTAAGTRFEDELNTLIPPGDFFAAAAGRLVEAQGNLNGARFAATEASLEN